MTILSAALLLFLILDPLGNVPVFLSVLKPLPPHRQRVVLVRELLIALGVLMAFLWGGKYALELMHLRQESVAIAGGIVLFLIGIRMIFPRPEGLLGELPDGEPFIVPSAPIASPERCATMPLLVRFSRAERTSIRAERAATRSVSMSKVSLPSSPTRPTACRSIRANP